MKANYDICNKCFLALKSDLEESLDSASLEKQNESSLNSNFGSQFYIVENATDEDILHEYHQCNGCSAEPIWGLRFKCSSCDDCDLCESCFDSRLMKINLKQ